MSYHSIVDILGERRIDLNTADDAEMRSALFAAFQRDLPLGIKFLRDIAGQVHRTEAKILDPQDPNSPVGRQLIRLLGTDIARNICEQQLGLAFGLYNCCGVVAAPTQEMLQMSPREQIHMQNGVLASADC